MNDKERAKEESSVSTTEQKPDKHPRMDFQKKKVSLMSDITRRNKSDILQRLANPSIREESPLVLYKVLPVAKELVGIKEKEPKDKYSIEYLWNIGANLRI